MRILRNFLLFIWIFILMMTQVNIVTTQIYTNITVHGLVLDVGALQDAVYNKKK